MPEDSTVNQDKFDAVLRRLISAKPQTEQETKAKAKTERAAKKAAKTPKGKVSG
jgi:hypothetical protein